MREIALFVEDQAHYEFLSALIDRFAQAQGTEVALDWQNVRRGHGAVISELRQYLRDLKRNRGGFPDLVIVATDSNYTALNDRLAEIYGVTNAVGVRTVCAVPDPHVERWLMLDSAAFKAVFGRGCDAPDKKCERGRYKKLLIDAICAAGIVPSLGGIEFAGDIVRAMDLDRMEQGDDSLGRFLAELRAVFQGWQP